MFRYVTLVGIVALSLFQQNMAMASGDFTKSCSDIDLTNNNLLDANCKDRNGNINGTFTLLDAFIANSDGRLVWQVDGNYDASSRNCDVEFVSGVTFLQCDTQKRNGNWTSSSLNLDEHIANIDGDLRYED